jgi:hypothetical protein
MGSALAAMFGATTVRKIGMLLLLLLQESWLTQPPP